MEPKKDLQRNIVREYLLQWAKWYYFNDGYPSSELTDQMTLNQLTEVEKKKKNIKAILGKR